MANGDNGPGEKKVGFGIRHRFKPQLSAGSNYLTFLNGIFLLGGSTGVITQLCE